MGIGYLKVELRTGNDSLPVDAINVLVKRMDGNALYSLVTDESGNTPKVELEAPDVPRLYNPNDTVPRYYLYEVEVKPKKGYMGKIIHGIHIFSNETTLLPVNMIPRASGDSEYEEIFIPSRFGVEIPKGYPPQDEEMISSQALGDVIIPDYITVHLGSPNSTANNVRVRFIDYVKNVASHEIFHDWPLATIEANMYAQISFVLNRVFTEIR